MEDTLIGIAVRGEGPAEVLTRALEPVRSDRKADHNYSVWLSADPQVFQRLEWGGCSVVRTRDPNRFGRALALHLGGHGAPAAGLVRADGVVAVHGGRATILPLSVRHSLTVYERALRDAGVILHDSPWVDLDPAPGEVVVEEPRVPLVDLKELIERLPPPARPEPVVPPGRYPLAGWYFPVTIVNDPNMSVADAVATVVAGLRRPLTDENQLEALAALFGRIPVGRVQFQSPRHLLDHIGA